MWNTRDIPMMVESLLQNIHVLDELVLMLRLKSKLRIHNGYHNHNLTMGKPTFQFHDHHDYNVYGKGTNTLQPCYSKHKH